MFRPNFQVSQPLLATLKRIAVQVHVLNRQRPTEEAAIALREEALDLLAAAAGQGNDRAASNYRRTILELGSTPAESFDLRLLLQLHYRLSDDLLAEEQRGRLRRSAVPIDASAPAIASAGEKIYEPPVPESLPGLVRDLVVFVQEKQATLDPLLLAGLFHGQLLLIRPFVGANKLTARLATRILLSNMGLESPDLLAAEDSFRQTEQDALSDLASTLDFTPWLEHFAEGISAELAALEERQRRQLVSPETALQDHHQAILEYVDEHGFITDKEYGHLTDRAKATRSLDFKKLMELGLLVREGRGRGTFYRRKA